MRSGLLTSKNLIYKMNIVTGKEFEKLSQKARKFGAKSFDYSSLERITNMLLLFSMKRKYILATLIIKIDL